jgi:Flp pilus assembly protein CpaB
VILAQRTGQLSLVLRSIQDAHQLPTGTREAGHGLSVVRYGNITEDTGR